ncbi:hypothetical protein A176_002697 [Myxococcus hansupus]|uniref:Lipoprotein n=1 Tax=Pseudomyxococcus hansupus TaxID=1297742 RepID=A0A0H4WWQ7_9BACT|nr:hypothetical protein [Myxococcus hansupus]AKQ65785.1 hypothetical protein A176_002697 [Myxococcus hansupus]
MIAQTRIARSVLAVVAALGLGTACGGPVEELQPEVMEETAALDADAVENEPPRKLEDLIGALDREAGVLHVMDTAEQIVLSQLKAQRTGTAQYVTKDELTGDTTYFTVTRHPWKEWPLMFKLCPTGEAVLPWIPCPTTIFADPLTRIWQNASCTRRVQAPAWGICNNTFDGNSYDIEYRDAWRCGVGTGFCVERRAAKTVRYDYALAYCNSGLLTNVTPQNFDYLCIR